MLIAAAAVVEPARAGPAAPQDKDDPAVHRQVIAVDQMQDVAESPRAQVAPEIRDAAAPIRRGMLVATASPQAPAVPATLAVTASHRATHAAELTTVVVDAPTATRPAPTVIAAALRPRTAETAVSVHATTPKLYGDIKNLGALFRASLVPEHISGTSQWTRSNFVRNKPSAY